MLTPPLCDTKDFFGGITSHVERQCKGRSGEAIQLGELDLAPTEQSKFDLIQCSSQYFC
jgi:hypothetical protein